MDNLKFVSSWRGGIQGSKLPIRLGGIQLEGCSFDGTRLSENQHDSPSVSAIPPCVVAWVSKVMHLSLLFSSFFKILPSGMRWNVISIQKVSPVSLWLQCPRHYFPPIIGGSCHKYRFCCNKSKLVATNVLSRQIFVVTKVLLWQNMFVATKLLSWQITFIMTKDCFVVTNMHLSQQTHVCCDKTFVTTKMLLVASPANGTLQPSSTEDHHTYWVPPPFSWRFTGAWHSTRRNNLRTGCPVQFV